MMNFFTLFRKWFSSRTSISSRVEKICQQRRNENINANQFYDQLSFLILEKVIRAGDCCIDVGCHRGHFSDAMLTYATDGSVLAFEPLPEFFSFLQRKYKKEQRIHLYPYALSNGNTATEFVHVLSNPAYSGFRQRPYANRDEKLERIQVESRRLDNLIPDSQVVRLIKIDVEGAEFLVLEGAARTIKQHKPFIIFEHAKRPAASYDTKPEAIWDLLVEACGLKISLLDGWLMGEACLSKKEFLHQLDERLNYYFLAHPERYTEKGSTC